MFNAGDKVVCIDNDNNTLPLTVGKKYYITRSEIGSVLVYGDDDDHHKCEQFYYDHRFKLEGVKMKERFVIAFGQPKTFNTEAEALEFIKDTPIASRASICKIVSDYQSVEVSKVEWTKIV